MKILLSIIIPTYKRSFLFRNQINALLKEINNAELTEDVEIVVGDNSSTEADFIDSTRIRFNDNKITYIDNRINLGFDQNIYNLIEKSEGSYVWFLSDDDNVIEGGVIKVIEVIRGLNLNPPTLIIINNHPISNNEFQINSFIPYHSKNLPLIKTLYNLITDVSGNELQVLHLVLLSSQISSCIVINDKASLQKINRKVFTGHPHSQFVYYNLKKKATYYIISDNLVNTRNRQLLSPWFYNATIYGITNLYRGIINDPKYRRYRNRIRIHTISYTINLLSNSFRFNKNFTSKIKFNFKEIFYILSTNWDLIGAIIFKLIIAKLSLLLYPFLRLIYLSLKRLKP
jgi:hypothetical protein